MPAHKKYESVEARDKARLARIHADAAGYARKLELTRKSTRIKRANRKAIVFAHYGAYCARCGFDDSRVLQIDHVNDDGYLERRDKNGKYRGGGLHIADDLAVGKRRWEDFQLLCANCNWLKQLECKNKKR